MTRVTKGKMFIRKKALITIVLSCFFISFIVGYLAADQPHMKKALNALYLAKSELKIAAEDKGGHRVKAMDYIGKAIAEVKKGIKAGSK